MDLNDIDWGAEVDSALNDLDPLERATLRAFQMDIEGNGAELTLALLRKGARL